MIVEAASAARNKAKLKLRQPVSRLIVSLRDRKLEEHLKVTEKIILGLANAKKLEIVGAEFFEGLKVYDVEPNYRAIGPEFRKLSRKIVQYIEENKQRIAEDIISKGSHEFTIDGEKVVLEPRHVNIKAGYPEWLSVTETPLGLVAVDTRIGKDELIEGLTRDVVRRIQAMRKELDLPVEAKVRVWLVGDEQVLEATKQKIDYLKTETRAEEVNYEEPPSEAYTKEWDID
ncbi:MAG: DUF5915 domain-containing protein, partial [Desulfurococcales archaeon]|nr:DUF5915 domain-containing protein [Desulfurococcales archaeon]